jgi:uncharacterized RDD family membrane protein YckC
LDRPGPRLGTETETLGARVVAFLIDLVLVAVVTGVLAGGFSLLGRAGAALGGLVALVVGLGYFIYLEGTYGQTLGKRLMSVVVVTDDGHDIGYVEATLRHLLRIVDNLPFLYIVGFVAIFLTERNQRVGDLVAGTVVVRAE